MAAAVMADRRVVDPEALEQPERLREVARGDLDVRAASSVPGSATDGAKPRIAGCRWAGTR